MSTTMLRRAARAALTILALAGAAACDAELLLPTAAAPAVAEAASATRAVYHADETYGYGFLLHASCANGGQGEDLWASGQVTLKGVFGGKETSPGTARTHAAYTAIFTGTAVGQTSGDQYDVASREITQATEAYDDWTLASGEEQVRQRVRLTNRATGAVIDLALVGRWVQTPTGAWVVDKWEATARC